MSNVINRPWECSASYVAYYQERREHVARWLADNGSGRNSEWPDQARYISDRLLSDHSLIFYHGKRAGECGIERQISGKKLSMLFPNRRFDHGLTYHVQFTEHVQGNVRKTDNTEMIAAVPTLDGLLVVSLGCDHPNIKLAKAGQQYTEYHCPDCQYRYGVDTSD